MLLDNLGIHTPKGSLLVRRGLAELRGQLILVYTPAYDPESNRIERLWRSLRRAVTHTHRREALSALLDDADALNSELVEGPRLGVAGHILGASAGHGDLRGFDVSRWSLPVSAIA